MNSVPKLIDSICAAWAKSLPIPYGSGEYSAEKDGMTDCNRFVHEVAAYFGYKGLWDDMAKRPLLANEMFERLQTNGEWMEISGETAQYHANNGALVIAAWKDPLGGHGHVCIVRPGLAETSHSWNVDTPSVPKVANVGPPSMCRIDRKASFAFSLDKMPSYFVLKEMIP